MLLALCGRGCCQRPLLPGWPVHLQACSVGVRTVQSGCKWKPVVWQCRVHQRQGRCRRRRPDRHRLTCRRAIACTSQLQPLNHSIGAEPPSTGFSANGARACQRVGGARWRSGLATRTKDWAHLQSCAGRWRAHDTPCHGSGSAQHWRQCGASSRSPRSVWLERALAVTWMHAGPQSTASSAQGCGRAATKSGCLGHHALNQSTAMRRLLRCSSAHASILRQGCRGAQWPRTGWFYLCSRNLSWWLALSLNRTRRAAALQPFRPTAGHTLRRHSWPAPHWLR